MPRFTAAGLCGILALVLSVFTGAQEPSGSAAQAEGTRGLWFVELSSPPAADGTSAAVLEQERNAFRAAAAERGLQIQERYSFSSLWNGVSIRISPNDVGRLAAIPGVRAIYPVQLAYADPERSPDSAELYTALAQTGADVAQAAGYTGAGIRVAVIDSGTDYQHPDLGGCFGPGCRVEEGYDFVGDA
ncbi:MAG: peptidase S8, partial [Acidobacteria bacterium]|nr:peptidase S8 [Acidobacteriota bacterium]